MNTKNLIAFVILVFTFSLAKPALALDQIYSPNVEEGEISVEYNASHTFDRNPAKDNAQGNQVAIEYGVNNRWVVETGASFDREPQGNTRLTSAEVETRAQF